MAGRDPSGIPTAVDGQPVRIGLAAVVHAASTTDDTPFLVGGWFYDASAFTCSGGGSIGRDPSPLLTGCATVVGGNSPWSATFPGPQGHLYWNEHTLPDDRGPSIIRVHTHDPGASDCRADSQGECEAVLVVEEVVWTGDDWTRTDPVSVVRALGKLDALNIQTSFPTGPQSTLSVGRDLFTTAVDATCPSPWPHAVFELHGDPRFGLVAIFPDEGARASAQVALDPANPGCAIDPRIDRPGAPAWAGDQNVLALVYGEEARVRTQAALDGSINRDVYLPLPPEDLDESYRVVEDALAARADGNLDGQALLPIESDGGSYRADVFRRFVADALRYTIAEGRPVTEVDMEAKLWAEFDAYAVGGTAMLFVVDHPGSTDPALRTETLVGFRLREPSVDTWALIVLPRTPSQ